MYKIRASSVTKMATRQAQAPDPIRLSGSQQKSPVFNAVKILNAPYLKMQKELEDEPSWDPNERLENEREKYNVSFRKENFLVFFSCFAKIASVPLNVLFI